MLTFLHRSIKELKLFLIVLYVFPLQLYFLQHLSSTVTHISVFKGTESRDFRPSVFSLNCNPGSPDSWAKAVLNIDSIWGSISIKFDAKNRLRAMPHGAESILLLDNAKLKILFYCHGAGKITYD
jgi:hypothetical protein